MEKIIKCSIFPHSKKINLYLAKFQHIFFSRLNSVFFCSLRSIISSEEVDKNFEVYSPPDTNYSPSPIVEPYYSSEDDIETDNDDILSVDNENINEVHKAVTSVIKNHSQNSTTASIALALAALAMPVITKIVYNHWRSFIAGAICCSFSHFVAVPIDVVKTRIQCNPDQYSNAFEVLIQILRSNGLGGKLCTNH